jgi:hypothetical protein
MLTKTSVLAALLLISAISSTSTSAQTSGKDSVITASSADSVHSGSNSDSHLFIASTARALPAGQGYVSVGGTVWPVIDVAVGATDWLTINATTTWLPLGRSYGSDVFILVTSAKAKILEQDGLAVAVGGSYGLITDMVHDNIGMDAIYGIATYETREASATISLYKSIGGEWASLTAGGTISLIRGVALMAEGWIPIGGGTTLFTSNGETLLTGGARLTMGMFNADLGALGTVGTDGLNDISPFIRLSLAFGK